MMFWIGSFFLMNQPLKLSELLIRGDNFLNPLKVNMTEQREAIELCMSIHYKLMAQSDFWYNEELRRVDAVLCKTASDARLSRVTGESHE